MTLKKVLTIISIVATLLTCVYYGVKTYHELKPTIIMTTPAPTSPPISHKEVNTITWTREVVVGSKK